MRHSIAAAFVLMFATAPLLADPPAPAETAATTPVPVNMKKVCRPVSGGDNPLFPQLKCHEVAVAQPAATTQVALQSPAPHQ